MSNSIRVFYACDENYASITAISATSLLKYNPDAHIYVLGCDLKKDAIQLIESRVLAAGGHFHLVNVSSEIASLAAAGVSQYVSYAVYSRLFIAKLLPELQGLVLYLDCDTFVVDSVAPLFDYQLKGKPLAMAPDCVHPSYKRVVSLRPDQMYYNSGVMLIDLDAWRTARVTERLLEELAHPHGLNPLGDQDIIVRVLNDEIFPLEIKWNFLSQYYLQKVLEKPVICHFSGHTLGRPWYTSSKHPMRTRYREMAVDIGLSQVVEQIRPMAFEYRLQYWLYRLLPQFLFKPICQLMYRVHIRLTYGV